MIFAKAISSLGFIGAVLISAVVSAAVLYFQVARSRSQLARNPRFVLILILASLLSASVIAALVATLFFHA